VFFLDFYLYRTYKIDFVTREGLLPAVILLVLPFVVLFVLIKILPPWHEENIAALQADGID